MTAKQFTWFLVFIAFISLAVSAIYLRYNYLDPHSRYDLWRGEYQMMVPSGEWIEETIAEKAT